MFRSPPSEAFGEFVVPGDFLAISGRLLEVISDHLAQRLETIPQGALHPIGKRFVKTGSLVFGKSFVGGITDDLMPEAKADVIAHQVDTGRCLVVEPQQLLAHQRHQMLQDRRPIVAGAQRRNF